MSGKSVFISGIV